MSLSQEVSKSCPQQKARSGWTLLERLEVWGMGEERREKVEERRWQREVHRPETALKATVTCRLA